jgi:hypothetical protein
MATSENIYLAGPMRGLPGLNFMTFFEAAAKLRVEGHVVFSPAEHDCHVTGLTWYQVAESADPMHLLELNGFTLREALLADLTYICNEATLIAVLPGWEQSAGVNAELAVARALGVPVAYLDREYKLCGI